MTLMDTLRRDQLAARKARNATATGLLTALVGEAAMIGKNNGDRETTDDEALRVIKKFLDSLREVKKIAKAPETIAQADAEIAILEGYMPRQMTDAEIEGAIRTFLASKPEAKIGDIMGHLKSTLTAGSYDARAASTIAKSIGQ